MKKNWCRKEQKGTENFEVVGWEGTFDWNKLKQTFF